MPRTDLSDVYLDYIACLNRRDCPKLGQFVDDDVIHNGRRVRLSGYLGMLERDFDEIPDLYFNVQLLICDSPYIASRLGYESEAAFRRAFKRFTGRPPGAFRRNRPDGPTQPAR